MKRKIFLLSIFTSVFCYLLFVKSNHYLFLFLSVTYFLFIINIFKEIHKINSHKNANNNVIATITHDLKNPAIANIRAIELILNGKFGNISDNQRSFLNDLLNSCQNMLDMLLNLLWLYKFDNKIIAVNYSYFSIQDLIQEIFNENKLILSSKNHYFKKIYKAPYVNVYADKLHIKRIISNLIMNAFTHSKENSTINIEIYLENSNLIFLVKNEGPYISDKQFKSMFSKNEIFSSGSNVLSTGLGLYLSNSLLKLNGGKFIYNSSPDGINTFGFSINTNNGIYNNSDDNSNFFAKKILK